MVTKLKKLTVKRGPFIDTKRAQKIPGRTVKAGGIQKIMPQKTGQKAVTFRKGGLHATLDVPQGQKIPESKLAAALKGKYGETGAKQARFYVNFLRKGQRTASANR